MSPDRAAVLRSFDEQVRRDFLAQPGIRVERTSRIVRIIGAWNCILHADLDTESADEAISAQQDLYRSLGCKLEWKVYGHDQPGDLPERLDRAGFEPEGEETLMVFDLSEQLPDVALPEDVSIRRVVDVDGLQHVTTVGRLAFGIDFSAMHAEFSARLPLGTLSLYVAYGNAQPVAAARLEMPPNADFAGLYGGGTAPKHRRRGIYRSLVAARAREARGRGYRYLNVEAAPASRPILEQLGFVPLTSVRAWVWTPT